MKDMLIEHILNTTEAQYWERRRQVKARGYPHGWTKGEDLTTLNDPRAIVLTRNDDVTEDGPASPAPPSRVHTGDSGPIGPSAQ